MTKSKKISKSQCVKIGSILLLSICSLLIGYKELSMYKNEEINDKKVEEFFRVQNEELKDDLENTNVEENEVTFNEESYVGVLEIKKINLKRGFYSKESKLNNVNKNIQLIKESEMPNVLNGNLILAAHSGNSKVAFFNNLPKLKRGDEAIIHYKNKIYTYTLMNIYEIDKTGTAHIYRNEYATTLTLITCKRHTKKQIVFIFELKVK